MKLEEGIRRLQRFVARGDYGVGDERCRDFSIDACKKKVWQSWGSGLGKFGKSTSTRSDRLKGKRGTERTAESTSAAAQRLSRDEANWMFLGDLSRQAALVLPFLPRWNWIGLELRPGCGGLVLNGGSLSGRSRTEAVCGMVRVDFFFLARDNPPAVRSCSVLPAFAHARPRLSSAEGCRFCQPSTAVVWVHVTPPGEWIRQGLKERRGGERSGS